MKALVNSLKSLFEEHFTENDPRRLNYHCRKTKENNQNDYGYYEKQLIIL